MIATAERLADLLALRLRAQDGAPLVFWLDPQRRFERLVAEGIWVPNAIAMQERDILERRLLLANPAPGTILYATSRQELEPLEELVQCFGMIRTFDVDDLIADRGLSPTSASAAQAREHAALLLATWDRIGGRWWANGDLDLGLALTLRDRTEGDIVDLALAQLDRTDRRAGARVARGPSDADRFVEAVLADRLGLGSPATAETLARFALIADYAKTPTGRDRLEHLVENTDRAALSTFARRLAENPKRLERLRELFQYAQAALHASLDGFSIKDLATLRLAPGRIEAIGAAIRAEADAAGPAHAFDVLRGNEAALADDDLTAPFAAALEFDVRIAEGREWLAQPQPFSNAFIVNYVEYLGEIDRLYRHCVGALEGALRLACETHYREWLRDLNVAFATRLAAEPTWAFPNPQRALGASFASLQGRCAVVILDALRFEMGRDVFERLPKTTIEKQLDWAVATLPTKTEVGMSALVPSDEPLSLAAEGTHLVVRIGARITTVKSARDEIWRAAGFRVLWNGDLAREQIDDDRIVVFHNAVDELGETLQDEAFPHYEQLIVDVAKLLNDLARRGYAVIATADHGFLTLPPATDNKLAFDKKSDNEVRKRRYRVSSSEALDEPVVSRTAKALGVEGDVTVDFPPGASVFKTQGALGFVHGGIALQELVIPVLRLSPKKATSDGEPAFQIQFPKRLTARRVPVTLKPRGAVPSGTTLRLRVGTSDGAVTDRPFPWAADSAGQMTLTTLLPEDAPAGRVEIAVMIDAGPLLAAKTVEYEPHE